MHPNPVETLKFISLKVLSCLEVIFAGFQIDLPRGRASQTGSRSDTEKVLNRTIQFGISHST